ncbi:MAG: LemA family protein [Bacteroidales bacterium]|nr:LemA family protein [Candidatus Liminaster caballi]
MKKSTIAIIAVVAVVAIWAISAYNGLVKSDESVNQVWADVEASYQRRADLIPNLVNTVKGYAAHESETLEAVVAARAKATSINLSVDDLTEENMQKFQKAQSEISSALGRLIAVSESYPELKANENFSELQAQLEGTENRINEARKKFNAAVKEYNVSVRSFPASIVASFAGFERRAEFKAEEGSEKAPKVEF